MRLGTRASALAMTQAERVAAQLRSGGAEVELVTVATHGDLSTAPLTQIGGSGVFASALRTALLNGEIDLAVHSLKDLPVAPHPGLMLAAITAREDSRDAVISHEGTGLAGLAPGAKVGTGSPRRAAQLALLAPHVEVVDIRGNVETRIAAVRQGRVDAVVLAAAGLQRLDRSAEADQFLEPEQMLPAPGQGAVAVECRIPIGQDLLGDNRARDESVAHACAALDDGPTRACVTAERELLAILEAGCTAPVGALATPHHQGYRLTGWMQFGATHARAAATGADPLDVGREVAQQLLQQTIEDVPILVTERET